MKNNPKKGRKPAKTPQKARTKRKLRPERKTAPKRSDRLRFTPSFRHYLNRKVYYARDYGHRAWPLHFKAA